MDFVASYLLCVENKLEPSKSNISMLLNACNASIDAAELESFLSKTAGKTYEEIISSGSAMMTLQRASVASAPAADSAKAATAAVVEESESSDDAEMSFF